MSLILSLETSAKACSVALSKKGETIGYEEAEGEWKHSKVITLLIETCLKSCKVAMKDLEAVAVSQGPGSYTGLRVGASCAKGLAYGLGIPLISVPTLEIIAAPFTQALDAGRYIVPMIDARRMEVYYNLFNSELVAQQETTNLVLDGHSFEGKRLEALIFCGDGAYKMQEFDELPENWLVKPSIAHAKDMSALVYNRLLVGQLEDVAYYVPFYLKPPNITKSTKSLF